MIPSAFLVEDDSRTKTSSWINASSGNGDGSQVNQKHSETNWQRCQNLIILNPIIIKNHQPNYLKERERNIYLYRERELTGTWESLALRLASVAEKTV